MEYYPFILNKILSSKKYSQSESIYKNILESIDIILKNENIEDKNEIIEQKKFIMSNLAFCLKKQYKITESMKYDRIIIKKLDKKFAKSYARLINAYLDENNIACARYHYSIMQDNCSKEDINKFPEVIKRIDSEIKEKDSFVQSIQAMKNLFKNYKPSS